MDQRNSEFVRLLKQHDRRVAAYVLSLVPDWNDAEDLLQDTWVRLWEQFDEYQHDQDFGVWACTIARYLVMAYRKRASREKLHFSPEVVNALATEVTVHCDTAERRLHAMLDCVRRLNAPARDLLRLCYAKGARIKNVAVQLGRSVNGTYLMLSRLRHELYDCVEAAVKAEDGR
jgi:RNA polymerase sigma-70 factor (ECF subfamily)